MLRTLVFGAKLASNRLPLITSKLLTNTLSTNLLKINNLRSFSSILQLQNPTLLQPTNSNRLENNEAIITLANNIQSRTLTKFSFRTGKRKSVKTVLRRFYRLHWGGWIRTKAGKGKRLWTKSPARIRRLRQHVFCNATQSRMLDAMVGSYWRRPKYYVDDPYQPYHTREEFPITRREPRPYFPPETEQK